MIEVVHIVAWVERILRKLRIRQGIKPAVVKPSRNIESAVNPLHEVAVLVVTILDVEFYAAYEVFLNGDGVLVTDNGIDYRLGNIPSLALPGQEIKIALACARNSPGLTTAALLASSACNSMPNLELIIVCGIAGGYPTPHKVETHVRLGDILMGINTPQDQSFGKQTADGFQIGHEDFAPPDRLCSAIADRLRIESEGGGDAIPQWEKIRGDAARRLEARGVPTPLRDFNWGVPATQDTFLVPTEGGGQRECNHPKDQWRERYPDRPRLFCGAIDSGNYLEKDARERDLRRQQSGGRKMVGYEMEGAAIAKAATESERRYFQVRSVVDYQDSLKNDEWHPTAALRAAAMAMCIIQQRPASTFPGKRVVTVPNESVANRNRNLSEPDIYNAQLASYDDRGLHRDSAENVHELIVSLQEELDLKNKSEVLSLVAQLEKISMMESISAELKSRSAYAACHALIVCKERGYVFDERAFMERIQRLLAIASSRGGE